MRTIYLRSDGTAIDVTAPASPEGAARYSVTTPESRMIAAKHTQWSPLAVGRYWIVTRSDERGHETLRPDGWMRRVSRFRSWAAAERAAEKANRATIAKAEGRS